MKIISISDIHIKNNNDEAHLSMLKILRSQHVKNADKLILLGDIFDLMIGPYHEYLIDFNDFFEEINNVLEYGIDVVYVEGNHDFLIEELINSFNKKYRQGALNKLKHVHKLVELFDGDNILVYEHGDHFELGNWTYKLYTKFIRSRFCKLLSENFFEHKHIKAIGDWASSKSRKRNTKKYQKNESTYVRDKFRKSAEMFYTKKKFTHLIAGHSHCLDHYVSKEFEYANNGYFLNEKKFIIYENGTISFQSL